MQLVSFPFLIFLSKSMMLERPSSKKMSLMGSSDIPINQGVFHGMSQSPGFFSEPFPLELRNHDLRHDRIQKSHQALWPHWGLLISWLFDLRFVAWDARQESGFSWSFTMVVKSEHHLINKSKWCVVVFFLGGREGGGRRVSEMGRRTPRGWSSRSPTNEAARLFRYCCKDQMWSYNDFWYFFWEGILKFCQVKKSIKYLSLRIQICPEKGITPIFLLEMGLRPSILFYGGVWILRVYKNQKKHSEGSLLFGGQKLGTKK